MSNPLSLSLSLSQTLAELDAIPALLESIRLKAETTATQARIALEKMAVSLEDGEGEYKEPKELTELKAFEAVDPLESLHIMLFFHKLNERNDLHSCLIKCIDDLEIVNLLLKYIDPSFEHNLAIQTASNKGHATVVDRLLRDPRVNPADLDNRALKCACTGGYVEVVDRLLHARDASGMLFVDPSVNNNQAILNASVNGHVAVVERLLRDPRVNPADKSNSAIRYASQYGHVAVVELLLRDPRVDPSANDNEAIKLASANGHVAIKMVTSGGTVAARSKSKSFCK